MKRSAVALLVAVVAALVALTIRTTVSPDAIRADMELALSAWAGRPIALAGAGEVHLLPWPGVHWSAVTVSLVEDGTALGRIDEVEASLSPLGLVLGRAEAASLTLRRPDLRLAAIERPTVADLGRRLATLVPTRLTVVGGRIAVTGADEDTIDALAATVSWPSQSGRLDIEATFRRAGAPVHLSLRDLSPQDLLRDRPSRLVAAIEVPGLEVGFNGTVAFDDAHRLDGKLSLTLADPAALIRWLGRPLPETLLGGGLEVEGIVAATGTTATLAPTRALFGRSPAKGVLSLRWDTPEPLAGGTLAFDTIDIRDDRAAFFGPGWMAVALDRQRLPVALDLRLSARRLITRTVELEKVAASLHLAEHRLNAEIGDATLWDSPVSLVMSGDLGDGGLHAQIKGSARDLPVADIAKLFGIDGVEAGTAGVNFDGETRCTRLGTCLESLDGRVRVTARNLTVVGLSPFGDVSRFHPVALAARSVTRKSNWQRADLDLRLLGEKATVTTLEVIGDVARFTLTGTGDLATGRVDLAGSAAFPTIRLDPTRNGNGSLTVPIRIGGSVRHLEVTPGSAVSGVEPPKTSVD